MQQAAQPPSKNWKRDAMKKAGVISDAFEVFKAWLAHFANWILFFCLIGNILQTVVSLGSDISGILLCIQCVMLDVAGASLYTMAQHAKAEGNEKGAKLAMNMSIILIVIMTITALNGTLNAIFPALSWLVQDVNYALIFARIVIVVLYGNIVHQLNTSTEMHDNRIEELEQALSEKVNEVNTLTAQFNTQLNTLQQRLNTQLNTREKEVNTLTAQFNTQLNTLQQQLNTREDEVNTLRVKVNTQAEEINVLGVKLESKETQLASVKGAHEGSLGAIQEAQSRVKSQLAESHKEVESLRTLLLKAQGALHDEKQLNTQLNTQTEELNTLRVKVNTLSQENESLGVKVNAQLNTREEELNTKTDDLDTHKIVQLDTQTADSKNYELRIRNLLASEPGLPGREISRRVGCSVPTACNWKKLIENERKEA